MNFERTNDPNQNFRAGIYQLAVNFLEEHDIKPSGIERVGDNGNNKIRVDIDGDLYIESFDLEDARYRIPDFLVFNVSGKIILGNNK